MRLSSRSRTNCTRSLVCALLTNSVLIFQFDVFGFEASSELSQFVNNALIQNPAIRAANASLRSARTRESVVAESVENPTLVFDSEQTGTSIAGGESQPKELNFTVGVEKEFDVFGKRMDRVSIAKAEYHAAEAEFEVLKNAVVTELLLAMASYQSFEEKITLLQQHEKLMQEFATLSGERQLVGDISGVEVKLANLALLESKMRRASAETEKSLAKQVIQSIVRKQNPSTWPPLSTDFSQLQNFDSKLIETLPAMRVAKSNAAAASAIKKVDNKKRLPSPTVSLKIGREDDTGLVSIGFSLPLAVQNRFSHTIKMAEANEDALLQVVENVRLNARVQIDGSAERYRIARETWKEWQLHGLTSLDEREQVTRQAWQLGDLDAMTYLIHAEASIDARLNALEVRLATWEAWFEWLSASDRLIDWLNGDLGSMK